MYLVNNDDVVSRDWKAVLDNKNNDIEKNNAKLLLAIEKIVYNLVKIPKMRIML
ncbi:MAG: hypothetical protein LE180_04830 [Endomicrobium sp.]|uniref:hypothetical protein n=1 Tax=Candidatus Endomicrobiellum pyrsonymphae TaxID=1408203 RepID=UPI0035743D3F|nr:hypothetical protein [Endomicrobium sp.]